MNEEEEENELMNDPLGGIDYGPCNDFAPDSLGDDPKVCIACFYHEDDHTPEEREAIIANIRERIIKA